MESGNGSNSTTRTTRENFEAFFNGWLDRQESFLQQLVQALTLMSTTTQHGQELVQQQGGLVQQVLSHYQEYLEEKSKAAKQDVFLFFASPWLTSFERALLWVGGFKPLLLFRLLSNSVTELTPEQEAAIEQVKCETRREERELGEAMATIQESVATSPLLNLFRRFGRLVDGQALEFQAEVEALQGAVLRTLERADKLRESTVRRVMEVLSPSQIVKFLVAAAQFQLRVRKLGLTIDQRLH